MKFLKHLDPFVDVNMSVCVVIAYVALGLGGNRFMQKRIPLELTGLKFAYNLAQILICTLVFLRLLPFFTTAEHAYGLMITPNPTVEWWVFIYYCCKLLDFGDTIFIVLGKKTRQFTVLHVWHHASIVVLFACYLSHGLGSGFICTLPLLNSLVHVLMYSHYLVTSLVTFKNMWWKPLITGAQMGHHMVLIVFMILNGVYGNPEWTLSVAIWGILWGLSILGLFLQFFFETYTKISKSQ